MNRPTIVIPVKKRESDGQNVDCTVNAMSSVAPECGGRLHGVGDSSVHVRRNTEPGEVPEGLPRSSYSAEFTVNRGQPCHVQRKRPRGVGDTYRSETFLSRPVPLKEDVRERDNDDIGVTCIHDDSELYTKPSQPLGANSPSPPPCPTESVSQDLPKTLKSKINDMGTCLLMAVLVALLSWNVMLFHLCQQRLNTVDSIGKNMKYISNESLFLLSSMAELRGDITNMQGRMEKDSKRIVGLEDELRIIREREGQLRAANDELLGKLKTLEQLQQMCDCERADKNETLQLFSAIEMGRVLGTVSVLETSIQHVNQSLVSRLEFLEENACRNVSTRMDALERDMDQTVSNIREHLERAPIHDMVSRVDMLEHNLNQNVSNMTEALSQDASDRKDAFEQYFLELLTCNSKDDPRPGSETDTPQTTTAANSGRGSWSQPSIFAAVADKLLI